MEPGELTLKHDEFVVKKSQDEIELSVNDKSLENYPIFNIFKNLECDVEKISSLSLSGCNLSKCELPNVVNLRNLDLSRNQLKQIPQCIYVNFPFIKRLDFSHNFLKEFDVEPACCANLEVLKLNDNNLYNLPQWIIAGVSKTLQEVDYSNNLMRVLKTTSKQNLKKIEMRNSNLRDVDFRFFKKLSNLNNLDISNLPSIMQGKRDNLFKEIDDLFIKPKFITSLEVLKLNNLGISVLSSGVFWLSSLVELHLSIGFLTWIPAEIQYLTNLSVLDVSRNELFSLPEELSWLEYLKVIKAGWNHISTLPENALKVELLDLYENYLEEIPEWMQSIPMLDLERNVFNTADIPYSEEYKLRKEQLRGTLGDSSRRDGKCEPVPERQESETSYNSSDESCDDYYKFATLNVSDKTYENLKTEEENWDDDYNLDGIGKKSVDNSLISPSDDEWLGDSMFSKKVIKKCINKQYVEDEDWLFCDAD